MFEKLRYRILRRSIKQFIAEKKGCRMPDLEKLGSAIIVLEDLDKETVRSIEERVKELFGISKIRFIIITEKASNNVLLSDQYCEVTTKDFGFMKVLKKEKQEEIHKLPMTHLIVNMAKTHLAIGDYLATLPNASFRVSMTKSDYYGIYDLIIDSGSNSNPVKDVEALYKYLKALTGK
ncbi:MAG: hypothetical protein II887_02640 [Bacteroidales bacterium]|nr:hypothetical protein [Bacteroidales bacterium]